MPTIPADIAFIVSILVSALSNYLRSDGLPHWANALIAIVALVFIAVAIGWLTTGFTLDIKADVLLVIGLLVALFSGLKELGDLLGYLQNANSPLAPAQTPMPPIVRRGGNVS